MVFADLTIREFLDRAASSSPTPGGGSVAAVVGALATSMATMVANLTRGKEKYADVKRDMDRVAQRGDDLIKSLLGAANQDAAAYQLVMDAYRLPKDTDEEKLARHGQIQRSLLKAAQTPLLIANLCRDAMGLATIAQAKGTQLAVSDAVVAIHLAYAAMLSAAANIDANVALMEMGDRREQLVLERDAVLRDGAALLKKSGVKGYME